RLARRGAGGNEPFIEGRAVGAKPARSVDAFRLRALSRPHVLCGPELRAMRSAVGDPGDGACIRLERWLRHAARGLRKAWLAIRTQCRGHGKRSMDPSAGNRSLVR